MRGRVLDYIIVRRIHAPLIVRAEGRNERKGKCVSIALRRQNQTCAGQPKCVSMRR
jgi:hypothetical protein